MTTSLAGQGPLTDGWTSRPTISCRTQSPQGMMRMFISYLLRQYFSAEYKFDNIQHALVNFTPTIVFICIKMMAQDTGNSEKQMV